MYLQNRQHRKQRRMMLCTLRRKHRETPRLSAFAKNLEAQGCTRASQNPRRKHQVSSFLDSVANKNHPVLRPPVKTFDTTQPTPSPSILKQPKHEEPITIPLAANPQTLENTTDSNTSLAAVWENACDLTLQRVYDNGRAFLLNGHTCFMNHVGMFNLSYRRKENHHYSDSNDVVYKSDENVTAMG